MSTNSEILSPEFTRNFSCWKTCKISRQSWSEVMRKCSLKQAPALKIQSVKKHHMCHQSFIINVNLTSLRDDDTCVRNVHSNLSISTLGCLSGPLLDTEPRTSSHPHHFFFFLFVYSFMPVSQLLCEWAGAKKGGKLALATVAISPHRIILCDDLNLI